MKENLTPEQFRIMRGLLIKEARELGYGKEFDLWNMNKWPPRLRQLRLIDEKLLDKRKSHTL